MSTRIIDENQDNISTFDITFKWIHKKYNKIFLEELSSELSSIRWLKHRITFYNPHLSLSFHDIFRLSQLELQELHKQLQILIKDEKISSSINSYNIFVLFIRKKDDEL